MLHDFQESLAKSHAQESAPWWEEVYRSSFPGFHNMYSVREDGWAQRGGVDRVVNLNSGRRVLIDEKVRHKHWPDIILERWSDRQRQRPGWIQKDQLCEYIAYAFVPSRRCYLLPFLNLRKAWLKNGRDWCSDAETNRNGFSVVLAENHGYTTESIAVPVKVLMDSIQSTIEVEWKS